MATWLELATFPNESPCRALAQRKPWERIKPSQGFFRRNLELWARSQGGFADDERIAFPPERREGGNARQKQSAIRKDFYQQD